MKFIVSGGIEGKFAAIENRIKKEFVSHFACLELVDFESKEISFLKKVVTDASYRPNAYKDVRFTSCSLHEDELYVPSPTQIFVYDTSTWEVKSTLNSPLFNDVHHVEKYEDEISVVSTGVDSFLLFDLDYNLKKKINVLGKEFYHQFPDGTDFRKISTTKKHESHPNFTFRINGDPWVTRFYQKDAINVYDPSQRIDIGVERVHDGHVIGDTVYFTTVNGFVIGIDVKTKKRKVEIDINKLYNVKRPLGWCRSFALHGDDIYIGFTSLRATKIEANIRWMRHYLFNKTAPSLPSRICKINLKKQKLVDEFIIPHGHINQIFSIIPFIDY